MKGDFMQSCNGKLCGQYASLNVLAKGLSCGVMCRKISFSSFKFLSFSG